MTEQHLISLETTFSAIQCEAAFKGLNQKQSLYAYNFAQASWSGAKICYFQRSYQSPALLYIIIKAFDSGKINSLKFYQKMIPELGCDQLNKIYIYLSAFFDNTGNYKSFGDSKFIPGCSQQSFRKFWLSTQYWSTHKQNFQQIYSKIEKYIFSYQSPYALINFSDKNGTTGYYSANITSQDAQRVKQITIKKGLMSENNRLVKLQDKKFLIKIASQDQKEQTIEQNGYHIKVQYGQFAPFMKSMNHYLSQAKKYCANQIQEKMIDQYIKHFKSGDMQKHKQSQRLWIQDKQPVIQTCIGFIQSYLDPLKIRAEFQGFVAVVNQQQSQILTKLVENAQTSLKYLPWGPNFQVQQFKKPDFTSLQVLAFGSSGIPVGINIPNYDDIRQHLGFKNVNLGNAYGTPTVKSIQFVPQSQIQSHLKYYKQSLFVIVALHQLLGHGSGKLFREKPNFTNPIDNSQINTFYKENQTWHSVFGQIASTYEECRADSVAAYLSTFQDIQQVLLPKYTKEQRWQIVYAAWYELIVGGIRGMQYFDPQSKKWLQAHIGAAFAIFKVLQEQGGIFEVKETQRQQKPYLQIHLNKQAIKTKGRDAIGKFLKHLQVYKSTADHKGGQAFFNKYLEMNETLLDYRKIVMLNKRPRKLTIQPVVQLQEGKPVYKMHPHNSYGCIDSGLAHFSQNAEDIINEWNKNNQEFRY